MGHHRNDVLAQVLDTLGWSPGRLAREVNLLLGPKRVARWVSETLPFKWRDEGVVPRPPLPDVVAAVLSEALGEVLSPDELWPGRVVRDPQWVPANNGLDTVVGSAELLDAVRNTMMDRRTFFVIAGLPLVRSAWDWQRAAPGEVRAVARGDRVTPELLDVVENTITALRHLDDNQVGGFVLKKTESEIGFVAELLRHGAYGEATSRRLHIALAELTQLAGFLSYDLCDHGRAQRYYLTALHATHIADDRALGARVLSCMAYQSMTRDRPQDALTLIDTAQQGAKGHATPTVMAELAVAQARAHAAAGDAKAFAHTLGRAETLLQRARPDDDPPWIYWMDYANLCIDAGSGFLRVGDLDQAEARLREGIALRDTGYARDRAVYLPDLAEIYRRRGELEAACDTARTALRLTASAPEATQSRAATTLRAFRDRLTDNANVPAVKDFLDEADTYLVA